AIPPTFTIGTHTPGTLLNKTLYVPYIIDGSGNIYFSNFSDKIILDSGATTVSTTQLLVGFSFDAQTCMMVVDNASGTCGSDTTDAIIDDNNNAFMDNGL